jgi:hypothetical protein
MNQATLDLRTLPTAPADRIGFELGWDHAHHGLVPPAGLLLAGTPVSQGWQAGKAIFGRRTLATHRPVRLWLQLRTEAWLRGRVFEGTQVTPFYLAQIAATHCPVTRQPLGGAPGTADAPVVVRLHDAAGYAAGNLAVLSQRAATAKGALSAAGALRRAQALQSDGAQAPAAVHGLSADEWTRLAVLMACVTPLPHAEAVRLPLRVMPPHRVRLMNEAQGLQALMTLQFATPGWSERLRALADLLPDPGLRTDFNLFVGALAPRVLEAGPTADARTTRLALEDAWADARVNRRWQHLALQLGEAGTSTLLERAAAAGLAGVRTLPHAPAVPNDGGALARRGRIAPRQTAQAASAGRATAGSPPKNRSATSGASVSCVNAPPGLSQVKVQLIMPNSNRASGVCS